MKKSVQKGSFLSLRTIIRPIGLLIMFDWRDREPDPRDISARPPGSPGPTPGTPGPDPRVPPARPPGYLSPTPGIPRPDPQDSPTRPPGSPGPTPRDPRLYPPPSAGPRLAFPRYLYKRASQLTANSPRRRAAVGEMVYVPMRVPPCWL